MAFESAKQGGRLSASELRRVGVAIDRSQLHSVTGADGGVSSSRGGSAIVPTGDEFFTAKITDKTTGTPDLYSFVEVWGPDPDTGEYDEKPSGRTADKDTNPALAVDGSGYAAGDIVLVRRHLIDPNKWEIIAKLPSASNKFPRLVYLVGRSGTTPDVRYTCRGTYRHPVYGLTWNGLEYNNARPMAYWSNCYLDVNYGLYNFAVLWEDATNGGYEFLPLPDAASDKPGYVNTGSQTFAGAKTFTGKITGSGDLQIAGDALVSGVLNVPGNGNIGTLGATDVTISGTLNANGSNYINAPIYLKSGANYSAILFQGSPPPGGGATGVYGFILLGKPSNTGTGINNHQVLRFGAMTNFASPYSGGYYQIALWSSPTIRHFWHGGNFAWNTGNADPNVDNPSGDSNYTTMALNKADGSDTDAVIFSLAVGGSVVFSIKADGTFGAGGSTPPPQDQGVWH